MSRGWAALFGVLRASWKVSIYKSLKSYFSSAQWSEQAAKPFHVKGCLAIDRTFRMCQNTRHNRHRFDFEKIALTPMTSPLCAVTKTVWPLLRKFMRRFYYSMNIKCSLLIDSIYSSGELNNRHITIPAGEDGEAEFTRNILTLHKAISSVHFS